MSHPIYLLLSFLTVLMQLNLVSAIKCWTCQSNVDPKCADPFDNTTLPITDCDSYIRNDLGFQDAYELVQGKEYYLKTNEQLKISRKPMFCRKIRQKVKGEWRTLRGCAYLGDMGEINGDENNCVMRQGTFDTFMESCLCRSKDLCNAGSSMKSNNYLSLAVSLLLVMQFKTLSIN